MNIVVLAAHGLFHEGLADRSSVHTERVVVNELHLSGRGTLRQVKTCICPDFVKHRL